MDRRWVDDRLTLLHRVAGDFRPNPQTFLFEPTESIYGKLESGKENDLESVTEAIARHIGIVPSPSPTYDWGIKMDLEVAGQFTLTSSSRTIKIPFFYVGKKYPLGAILAHEMTHAFLFYRGIILVDPDENEIFTDVATIFIGLGKLLLNGIVVEPGEYESQVYSLGYLPHQLVSYCYRRVNTARDIPNDVMMRNLVPMARRMMDVEWKD